MGNDSELTRRLFLAGAGALGLASGARADEAIPAYDPSKPTAGVAIANAEKTKEMATAPRIKKTVTKVFDVPTIQPNGLVFTPTGSLLLASQSRQSEGMVFEVDARTGTVFRTIQTEGNNCSGITLGDDGSGWINSTAAPQGEPTPMTIKFDVKTGKTIKKFVTPGYGWYGKQEPFKGGTHGGHGIHWAAKGSGQYWMAVPASGHIFLMEAETNKILRALPSPVNRPHGLVSDGDQLWLVSADYNQVQKLDIKNGNILGIIQLDKDRDPSIHDLDMKDGVLWYSDADKGWISYLS